MIDEEAIERHSSRISHLMAHYLRKQFPRDGLTREVIMDYPTRPGKGIRPVLCIAACGAAGGDVRNAENTAVAIEFLHNAFLIKDDLVDGSIYRRGSVTLNRKYGFEFAINAGDALKCLTVLPLLDNIHTIGVRKTLQIVHEVEQTARRSVEGQLMELGWVKENRTDLRPRDYYRMCELKTCWYTIITPLRTGTIIGLRRATDDQLDALTRFGRYLGLAFQIRDDTLNLDSSFARYGKEINGDIREGKRTVMLITLLNDSSGRERERVVRTLGKPQDRRTKTELAYVRNLMDEYDCIPRATRRAHGLIEKAMEVLHEECTWMQDNEWTDLIYQMCEYLTERNK